MTHDPTIAPVRGRPNSVAMAAPIPVKAIVKANASNASANAESGGGNRTKNNAKQASVK
jgi:hypothetical protein